MKIRSATRELVLAAALLLMAAPLGAQRPYAWVVPQDEPEASLDHPFEVVLEHRRALALDEAEVARIEGVRARLVEVNGPLLAQLRDAEIYEPEGDAAVRAIETVRERFAANARSAQSEVSSILGPVRSLQASTLIGHDSWAYPPPDEDAEGPRVSEPTLLVVENHNYYDATIYIVSGLRRQRMGFVGGLKDETLTIPESFVDGPSGIRFEVRLFTQYGLPLTDEVMVVPGNHVHLRVPPS